MALYYDLRARSAEDDGDKLRDTLHGSRWTVYRYKTFEAANADAEKETAAYLEDTLAEIEADEGQKPSVVVSREYGELEGGGYWWEVVSFVTGEKLLEGRTLVTVVSIPD